MTDKKPDESRVQRKYVKVPAAALAQARKVLGTLPHDNVSALCHVLDSHCIPVEEGE